MTYRIKYVQRIDREVDLSEEDIKHVAMHYLRVVIMGFNCCVNKDGDIEHWTSYPHGSGTTTIRGPASELQKAAAKFLEELRKEDSEKLFGK